ncbi:PREDICTED: WASH complex subunit FAM21C-like, partial [Rhinopithecus bieti]|uniref:WASH complex subunit FAM21C-like n=1 Tax=Rhinopithecus bieti TaxID=61621 RepID=UPI00083C723C
DNLFGGTAAKKQTLSLQAQREEKAKPSELSKKKASALLFSSDEEEPSERKTQRNRKSCVDCMLSDEEADSFGEARLDERGVT